MPTRNGIWNAAMSDSVSSVVGNPNGRFAQSRKRDFGPLAVEWWRSQIGENVVTGVGISIDAASDS
jgi:hypothetical protein